MKDTESYGIQVQIPLLQIMEYDFYVLLNSIPQTS